MCHPRSAGTIGIAERSPIHLHVAKHAETLQTAERIRAACGIEARCERTAIEVDRRDGSRWLSTRCCEGRRIREQRWSGIPSLPITPDSLTCRVCQNRRRDQLASIHNLLVKEDEEERFVPDDRSAKAPGNLVEVVPVRFRGWT